MHVLRGHILKTDWRNFTMMMRKKILNCDQQLTNEALRELSFRGNGGGGGTIECLSSFSSHQEASIFHKTDKRTKERTNERK